MCTCYASPTSSITHHRHIRSFDRISQLYSRASLRVACNWPPNSHNRSFVPRPIYIYIYIPPLSDIWFIPTSIVSHPLPLFVHNRHKKNRTSIHREYYYISFFSFLYIYILFSSYKHVFLPIIYLQFARDVASRAVNSNLGGGIYRPPRYLSIYLSSFDSRFRLSFVFFRTGKKRKRNDERTASARDSRAEKRIRESINTEKRSQPRRFRCWREASGEGRGGTEDEREER